MHSASHAVGAAICRGHAMTELGTDNLHSSTQCCTAVVCPGTHRLVCALVPALVLALLGLVLLGALGALVATHMFLAGHAVAAHCSSNRGQCTKGVRNVQEMCVNYCLAHNACPAGCMCNTGMHEAECTSESCTHTKSRSCVAHGRQTTRIAFSVHLLRQKSAEAYLCPSSSGAHE
jgi:hypothetical protein